MEPGGGDPEQEFCVLHCIMPASDYAYIYRKPLKNRPWVSIYVDETNEHVMREKPARYNPYIVSRWQMVPGIPDGFSPPAMYALPINRRLQQMYLSVLENAQKQADPPHVAVASAILGGEINLVNARDDLHRHRVERPRQREGRARPARDRRRHARGL